MRWLGWRLIVCASVAFVACDCDDDGINVGGACEGDTPRFGCGEACDEATPCGPGLYCLDGECIADCTAGVGCPEGQRCGPNGQCVPAAATDGGRPPGVCADVELAARPVTPNVILIIDQSGSMTAGFDGGSDRWDSLRDTLLDQPDGLIASLQDQIRFGLALYTGISDDDGNAIGECPRITDVSLALNNYEAISSVYNDAEPSDDTPTGDAVTEVLRRLNTAPDPDDNPTVFVIATDGEPDRCEELDPQNGQEEAIAAVESAFGQGIRSFVISVGRGVVSERHLQDVANAGLGRSAGEPDAEFWEAGNEGGLASALSEIVSGVLSCDVILDGRIDEGAACSGSVQLNGRPLTCDDENGWTVRGDNRIEVLGTACEELQSTSGAVLEARFPCDVILI